MPRGKRRLDLDPFLKEWKYSPGDVTARIVEARDGREVLQMRVELGILQMEIVHRPDGLKPEGFDSYYAFLVHEAIRSKREYAIGPEQYAEIDREFLQYYHRRMCWLQLKRFQEAVADADHTLALMDFVRSHCDSRDWVQAHEQYRPFVLFHRTQALSLEALEKAEPDAALGHTREGIEAIRAAEAQLGELLVTDVDEFVPRLKRMAESIRKQFDLGPSLESQLAEAVAMEQYELAAELRDEIAKRSRAK